MKKEVIMKNLISYLVLLLFFSSLSYSEIVVKEGDIFIDPGGEYTINVGQTLWVGAYYDFVGKAAPQISSQITDIFEWTGNGIIYTPPAIPNPEDSGEWSHSDWMEGYDIWGVGLIFQSSGVGGAVEFKGLSPGNVDIYLDRFTPVGPDDSFTLHVVPEPATILILGLGALSVLRKRK